MFQKVITMQRGGFCYELNGLFHWLLQELGFKVGLASGRGYDRNRNDFGPEFDRALGQYFDMSAPCPLGPM